MICKNRSEAPNALKAFGVWKYEGKEQSGRFRQLVFRAASEEIISMSKAANLANLKLAEFRQQMNLV